jgi:adenylate cyclase class 2
MQCAEIELKFPIHDLARFQSRLPALGFILETPRTFESNTLYDTPGRTLRETRQLLRIRRYGDLWTLTHKRKPAEGSADPGRYKVRIETETRIEDGPALADIFEHLGYSAVFRYEKFRSEWTQASTTIEGPLFTDPALTGEPAIPSPSKHLVIDETPIGNYAELEGPTDWIDATLARLQIDPAICITESYGRLFLNWKKQTGSPSENLTFDEVRSAELLEPSLR